MSNKEFELEYLKNEQRLRWDALRHMLKPNHVLKEIGVLMWLKALICLLLNRIDGDYFDAVEVCCWGERPDCGLYGGTEWECLYVKEEWKDWQVCISTDSNY